MQDEQYQKLAETRGCVLFPAYISGCRSLNRNLYVEGQVVGRIVLTECDLPLTPGTVCLLETLAIRLEYLMAHEFSANEAGDMEQIFVRILSDRTADPIQISHQLSSLGWKGDQEYLCLVLQITYLNQKQLSTKAICRYLKRQFPDAVSFLYEEEIVTFFNLSRLQMTEEEVGEKLVYFIRDSYLKAGYSRTLQGHMRLRRQYIQAQLALDVGGRRKPYLWIHHFNQIALPYILEQATRRLPGSMLCHEGLLRLKESDEKNHTEYVKTLKAYLEEKQSATQAARCLFIHRSTFLYRMERIQEILQSELDDPEEIFYLELSLRLLEQEEKREANKK
jgi:sugar diacid utilization regulator